MDTFFTVPGLILNKIHYWRVRAASDFALTDWSTSRMFFTRHDPTQISHPFPDVLSGDVSWADYDNDGDLDLAIGGTWNPTRFITFQFLRMTEPVILQT